MEKERPTLFLTLFLELVFEAGEGAEVIIEWLLRRTRRSLAGTAIIAS